MAKYRVLSPIKAADGKVYQANSIVELTDEEARNCLSFHAVELVQESSQQAPSVESTSSQETAEAPIEVLPPESDVR